MALEEGTSMIIFLLALLAIIIYYAGFVRGSCSPEAKKNEKEAEFYRKTYLWKMGCRVDYGSYDLRSFDGGQNWYAVKSAFGKTGPEKVEILGSAEQVFPGLLKKINGMEELCNYAKRKGPITELGPSEIEMFEKAGFKLKSDPVNNEKEEPN